MDFLRWLAELRTPAVTAVMSAVTWVGDETCFMVLALLVFWCLSKRQGYYLFAVGFAGIACNQFLKLWCRIPRPWVLDPDFTIVESARAGAAGYSFPSGHTQNAVGTLGVIALGSSRRWVRIVCLAGMVLVPFSRMYLGVHTPLDVGVAFLTALVLLALLWPLFRDEDRFRRAAPAVLAALLAVAAAYGAFVLLYHFPADVDAENLASGTKNAFTMLGAVLGLIVSYWWDRRYLHFDTRAPLLGQVGKLVLGLALLIGLRMVLKAPLTALLGPSGAADLVRYFLMVLFAGCIWPMTFPWFASLGRRREPVLK